MSCTILNAILADDETMLKQCISPESLNTPISIRNRIPQFLQGGTPIHYCAFFSSTKCFIFLKKMGAKQFINPNTGTTLLQYAASSGNLIILNQIPISDEDINARDKAGNDAFCYAAYWGQVTAFKYLLKKLKGYFVDRQINRDRDSKVMNIAAENGQIEMIRFLLSLELGKNLNAIEHACAGNQLEVVKLLLNNNFPIANSISVAAQNGSLSCLFYLLDVIKTDSIEIACKIILHASIGGHLAIVKHFFQKVPEESRNKASIFAFRGAAESSNFQIYKYITQQGFQPNDDVWMIGGIQNEFLLGLGLKPSPKVQDEFMHNFSVASTNPNDVIRMFKYGFYPKDLPHSFRFLSNDEIIKSTQILLDNGLKPTQEYPYLFQLAKKCKGTAVEFLLKHGFGGDKENVSKFATDSLSGIGKLDRKHDSKFLKSSEIFQKKTQFYMDLVLFIHSHGFTLPQYDDPVYIPIIKHHFNFCKQLMKTCNIRLELRHYIDIEVAQSLDIKAVEFFHKRNVTFKPSILKSIAPLISNEESDDFLMDFFDFIDFPETEYVPKEIEQFLLPRYANHIQNFIPPPVIELIQLKNWKLDPKGRLFHFCKKHGRNFDLFPVQF